MRNLSAAGRRTLAARLRAVPRGRLARVRSADFGADQLCGVPLLLHCRRAYSHADERAGDGRRTAGSGHRRHPVRACVVRLSGQEGAAGRFHRVSEEHADGSCRSFGQREKYGNETLRPILRPAAGACPFRWRPDDRNGTGKSDEPHLDGVPGRLSVSGHDTRQHPFRKARCDGRGDHRGSRESLLPRFHHAPAAGIRHDGGRRRLYVVRRRETAHIHRPCHPEGCADYPAGRSDRIARPGKRGGSAESHRHAYQRTYRHRHRPQAQDDYECGPDCRSGRRTGKGTGHARRADAAARALCPSVDDSGEIRRLDRIE